mgnify:CR=1 FL=1
MTTINYERNIIGNKYQEVKNLDVKDIAKLIRTDLKQFKDCKFSVSIQRYSGGRSVHVKLMSTTNLKRFVNVHYNSTDKDRLNFSKDFKERLESIVNQYNYDKSDPMTDYFNVNFYSHIDIDYNFQKSIEDKITDTIDSVTYFTKNN